MNASKDDVERTHRRVAIVDASAALGGVQRVSVDLAAAAQGANFSVEVVFFDDGPMRSIAENRGVTTVVTERWQRVAWLPLWRELRRFRADVVHVSGTSPLLASLLASKILRQPLLWHVQDPIRSTALRTRMWARVVAALRPALVVASSQFVEQNVRERISRKLDVITIANGLVPPTKAPSAERARAALGLDGHARIVAMFGRVTREKGVDDLIEAAVLLATVPDLRFLVVGPYGEGHLDDFLPQIEELGLGDRVQFTGAVSDELKWDLMQVADVVAHPSRFEPFGLVVIEAMYLSRPVVAARSWGPMNIITDGQDGVLVPPNDPTQLAAAIEAILADRELAETLGTNAAVTVRSRFMFDETARAVQRAWSRIGSASRRA
jgi:glycosyltransferase involved in cell wall biosynthesis